MTDKKTIQIFALGGTIAMTPDQVTGSGVVPTLDGDQLIAAVPGLASVADIKADTIVKLGSANLTFDHVRQLYAAITKAIAAGTDAIVVTQGTDMLEETAFLLSLISDFDTPIMVTGAMRHPGQPGSDGPANLSAAVKVAASEWAEGGGVFIVMNDQVMDPVYTRKRHTSSVAAFESQAGPLAVVVEDQVRGLSMGRRTERLPADCLNNPADIIVIGPTYSDDALPLDLIDFERVDGVVIEGVGGGHLPENWVEKVHSLVGTMPIVLTSRVGGGPVLTSTYGYKGAEIDLIKRGLIPSGWLDGRKARLLMCLTARAGQDAVKASFKQFSK